MPEYNGILIINKQAGMTSHDVVFRLRKILGTKKTGHCGTLDPMAEGVLVVPVGGALKASEYLTTGGKRYVAGIKLGLETDTQDITGKITFEYTGALPSLERTTEAAFSFVGKTNQTPPMFSALKRNGEKLVGLARRGIVVEREPREIFIDSIDVSERGGKIFLDVKCSKGTYIRTLCEDIGRKLGCGAVMESLVRTEACGFGLNNAVTINEISVMSTAEIQALLIPAERIFDKFPIISLPPFFERLFRNGQNIYLEKIKKADIQTGLDLRVYGADGFFALGETVSIDGIPVLRLKKFF